MATEDEKRIAYAKLGILEWKDARDKAEAERKANDPLNVKRYDYDEGDGNWRFPSYVEKENGKMVYYEDFVKAVDYLKAEIDKAYSRGKADGAPEYSWRL